MKIRGITKKSGQYRVYFYDGKLLLIHFNDYEGAGYTQWADYYGINDLDFEQAATGGLLVNGDEALIGWQDLPPIVQAQIEKMIYLINGQ